MTFQELYFHWPMCTWSIFKCRTILDICYRAQERSSIQISIKYSYGILFGLWGTLTCIIPNGWLMRIPTSWIGNTASKPLLRYRLNVPLSEYRLSASSILFGVLKLVLYQTGFLRQPNTVSGRLTRILCIFVPDVMLLRMRYFYESYRNLPDRQSHYHLWEFKDSHTNKKFACVFY